MDNELKGKWLSSRWEAQTAPYTAINHILRMYYDSSNASVVSGEKQVYDTTLSTAGFEVDHFIGIQFVAGYIVTNYDFRQLSTGDLELLSQHLNHPCNLYRVNKAFNQNIGKLTLEAFSNSSSCDPSIVKYANCKVTRKQINKDENTYSGLVVDGTVATNVQYLLNKMQTATGLHSGLTKAVGQAFSAYLSLTQHRDPPTVQENTKIGGALQKGLH